LVTGARLGQLKPIVSSARAVVSRLAKPEEAGSLSVKAPARASWVAGRVYPVTSLAIEWGPAVRVNCVVPGFVATEAVGEQYGDPATVAAVTAMVPLRRFATPDDVADACLFLASAGASYVSGSCLTLHGGGEPPAFLSTGIGAT
jgi:Enoyl-(Acyl carrier protein) reductase